MADPTSTTIQATIERVANAERDSVGVTGKLRTHLYNSSDQQVVTAELTDYEAYCVECELYGDDVASANYEVLSR